LAIEAPEDHPLRKANGVVIALIPANVHRSNEADLPVTDNSKHASKAPTVDLFVVLFMIHLLLILLASRHLEVP
jgi:hypothetical protein